MEPRIYHGDFEPSALAQALIAHFNRGNLRVQQLGDDQRTIVQIATRERPNSGGSTALTVHLHAVADGVMVQVSQQAWLGVAASLGMTAIAALRNPFSLISRLDDLAQDVEYLQLRDQVLQILDTAAKRIGSGHELSERLRRSVCSYCDTPNPIEASSCSACGAPLGDVQPLTCRKCGFVVRRSETRCPNCQNPL